MWVSDRLTNKNQSSGTDKIRGKVSFNIKCHYRRHWHVYQLVIVQKVAMISNCKHSLFYLHLINLMMQLHLRLKLSQTVN